jgi:glycerol-3-phosphate acyltransferase PlsX
MGSVYARYLLGRPNPRVGLLSIGEEDTKGNALTLETLPLLRRAGHLNFIGNVEGRDVFKGSCDVVVTDGFTGNVVLKTCESLGYAMMHLLKRELRANPLRMLGAMLSRGAFCSIKKRLDPEVYGGAALLGLNGIVIKVHGSARERAVMNAIRVATEEIRHGVNQIISQQIARANERLAAAETPVSPTVPA